MPKDNQKEKEKIAKLKALREELEEKLEEQLPQPLTEGEAAQGTESFDSSVPMEEEQAKQVIEALLFASSRPLLINEIRKVIKTLAPSDIKRLISELQAEYTASSRSFEILEVANGYEIATKRDFAPWVMKLELQKKAKQATQSALETLAIMAYKQPVTKAEVEELRGVDVSGVLNTLVERGLIKIVGKKEVPGRPFLYGTTDKFLEHFGLKSLNELPSIEEIKNLVESSVNKEELLGTSKVVEMPQDGESGKAPSEENQAGEQLPPPEETFSLDEIEANLKSVKIIDVQKEIEAKQQAEEAAPESEPSESRETDKENEHGS